ncbi:putative bifunctional diguanylate cyclase/phosphodiesterase [Cohnella cellulosilytica]|uniref:Bifunctional diguanylate cyclase/phosphodiesterase n=1 Tax=Cohnella cellulosilytica TaxID=986710 RepID=A0ABW2FN09_9BACL
MEELQRLQELASRYSRLTDLSFDPVIIYTQDARIRFVNDKGLIMLKGTRDQALGQSIFGFVLPEYWEVLKQRIAQMLQEGNQSPPAEIRIRNSLDELLDVEVTGIAIPYEGQQAILAIIRDITERKKYERDIEYWAYHDELTGLPNRRWFDHHVLGPTRQHEADGPSVGLMFIDFDDFKHVNDSLGHHFGDLLLQEIANRLREDESDRRIVVRAGGDEFMFVLLDMDSPDQLLDWSERILARFRVPFLLLDTPIHSTCSIGIAYSPEHGTTSQQLLKSADIALHRAKLQRNCAVMFDPQMEQVSVNRLTIIDELHKALEHGWFELHYQPQIDLRSGGIRGTEALIRMNHPRKGMLPPAYFIPTAETSSLMIPIGEWILQEACRQNMAWQSQGLRPMTVSVNVAICQFQEEAFADKVIRALERSGMPAELLELEITESCAADSARLEQVLQKLKPLGVQVSIDDFGTGYSSLSQLSQVSIDKLKIDRSFILQMMEHKKSENLVKAMITMAHNLQIEVVAEGMEAVEQVEMLRLWGCDTAQGYYFSKPIPAEKLLSVYRESKGDSTM